MFSMLAQAAPAVTLIDGLGVADIIETVSPLAVTALLAIAGVKLSISWFGAIINKLSGAGRKV